MAKESKHRPAHVRYVRSFVVDGVTRHMFACPSSSPQRGGYIFQVDDDGSNPQCECNAAKFNPHDGCYLMQHAVEVLASSFRREVLPTLTDDDLADLAIALREQAQHPTDVQAATMAAVDEALAGRQENGEVAA